MVENSEKLSENGHLSVANFGHQALLRIFKVYVHCTFIFV